MKAYVITQGDYSDYHICGVTLDEETAKKMQKYFSYYGMAEIEEWEMDNYSQAWDGLNLYQIIAYEDGRVTVRGNNYIRRDFENVVSYWHGEQYIVSVFAEDEEHAKKIGLDKIAEFKYRKVMGETE